MAEYDNTDRGVLFKNDRKTKDSQPDYTGNGNYNGVDFQISAWLKEGAKGKFFSFSFQPPYVPGADAKPKPAYEPGDDDIPFN